MALDRQFFVDVFWLGSILFRGIILLVGVIQGLNGVEGWWIVLLIGVSICAAFEAYHRLSGNHRRMIEAWEKSRAEAAATAEQEIASWAKEGLCSKCGGKLVTECTESGYAYTACGICGDRTTISTQYD